MTLLKPVVNYVCASFIHIIFILKGIWIVISVSVLKYLLLSVEKYFLPDLLDSFDLILNFLVQIQRTEAGKRLE